LVKKCKLCEKILPFDNFYKDKSMVDGHRNFCRKCTYIRDKPRHIQYRKTEGSIKLETERKNQYRKDNREKFLAHSMVQNHVRRGTLEKLPCEICGSTYRTHGHHEDYSKPLEVIWLCDEHHKEEHKGDKK